MDKKISFEKRPPSFCCGDEPHAIEQAKLQNALEASGFDAFLFFKAEAVRCAADFHVEGSRPFLKPEYVALVVEAKPPVAGGISGSDDLRIRFKSDIEDARRLPRVSKWHETIEKMLSDGGVDSGRVATDVMPHRMFWSLSQALGADAVVVCAAIGSRKIAAMPGDRIDVDPVKGYSITVNLTDESSQKSAPRVSLLDDETKLATSRLGSGGLQVAGTAVFNGANRNIRMDRIKPLVARVNECFPGVNTRSVISCTGLRPILTGMLTKFSKGVDHVFFTTRVTGTWAGRFQRPRHG